MARLAVVEHPRVPVPHGPRRVRCDHPRPPRGYLPSLGHGPEIDFGQVLQLSGRRGSARRSQTDRTRRQPRTRITISSCSSGTHRRFAGPAQGRVINDRWRNGRQLQGPPQPGRLVAAQLVQDWVGPPGLDPSRTVQVGLPVPAQVQAKSRRGQGREIGQAVASAAVIEKCGGASRTAGGGSASRPIVVRAAVTRRNGRRNRNCRASVHPERSSSWTKFGAVGGFGCSMIVFGSCCGAKPCPLSETFVTLMCDICLCLVRKRPAQIYPWQRICIQK